MEEIKSVGSKKPKKILIIVAYLVFLGLGFAGGIFIANQFGSKITVPAEVYGQVQFPIYLPKKLPDGFNLSDKSFEAYEGVLIFTATDKNNKKITFTEQAKPKDFNFDNFYNENLQNVQNMSDTPFRSIIGKSKMAESYILSVEADDTWVLITSELTDDKALKDLAKNLEKR